MHRSSRPNQVSGQRPRTFRHAGSFFSASMSGKQDAENRQFDFSLSTYMQVIIYVLTRQSFQVTELESSAFQYTISRMGVDSLRLGPRFSGLVIIALPTNKGWI